MLFFMDLSGDVLRIDTDKIYQGSNDLPKIQLVTPIQPLNTAIQVAFTLPNGITTVYYPMAVMGSYTLGDLVSDENINAPNVTQVYLWQVTMPENVTLKNGTVIITFKVLKPTNVVTIDDDFPTDGEDNTYYIEDGNYYTWVDDVGIYAPINTKAYKTYYTWGGNNFGTKALGRVAQQYKTTNEVSGIQSAEDVRIVGDANITYTQTDTANIIVLDYVPNEESIIAEVDGVEIETDAYSYNATLNRISFSTTGDSYSVTYSLSSTPQTIPKAYFATSDCETLQGHYEITTDTISAFNGAYSVVTTSPVPFTVTYAALPAPPNEATTDDVDALINLLDEYYIQNGAILVDVVQKINSGELIGLGEPTATATTLPAGSSATATATIDPNSPADAKVIDFEFGIPKGDKGDTGYSALSYGATVNVDATPQINDEEQFRNDYFNRPPQPNDTFFAAEHNTTNGRDYLVYYRVYEVGQTMTTAIAFFVSMSGDTRSYRGTILVSDWEHVGNRYFYTVQRSDHNLINPVVIEFLVETDEGKGNSFYSYNVRANGDIRFTSDLDVKGYYTILGE